MKKNQTAVFLAVVLVFVFVVACASWYRSKRIGKIVFADNLDAVIAKIDDKPLTLKDFAIYAVREEQLLEEQAKVYDYDDTGKYWNVHTNGKFIRLAARDAAIDWAIHDAIFYDMAMEEGISLNTEEEKFLANDQSDFWSDLEEEQQSKLSLSKEEVDDSFEKMALAQKMQRQKAFENGKEETAYDVGGAEYEKILDGYDLWKNEEVIDRIDFGNIVMDH